MENYQKKLEEIIKENTGRHTLALHSCCAPCSSYVLEYLMEFFDITLFFSNSNIYPQSEYSHRLDEQLRLCAELGIKAVECDYNPDDFYEYAKGLEHEPEGGARCAKCFEMRLERTASEAEKTGLDFLGTTLTVSPHKNAPLINKIGEAAAIRHNMLWLPSDFKKKDGYLKSIQLSRKYNLYRQNYCGCKFSMTRTDS